MCKCLFLVCNLVQPVDPLAEEFLPHLGFFELSEFASHSLGHSVILQCIESFDEKLRFKLLLNKLGAFLTEYMVFET